LLARNAVLLNLSAGRSEYMLQAEHPLADVAFFFLPSQLHKSR
jgi:hypothetical protein